MSAIPSAMRRSAFSRNTIHASSAVSTASRFNNSDADAAEVRVNPSNSATGASTPPNPMASNNHSHSRAVIDGARQPRSPAVRIKPRPMPLPRYSKPARRIGDVSRSNCLAIGVLAPNSSAATMAAAMAGENATRGMREV